MARLATILGAVVCLLLSVAEIRAETALAQVLRLGELSEQLHEEGLGYGAVIDRDMLNGEGGVSWRLQVTGIYAPARIESRIADTLAAQLSTAHKDQITAFFTSPPGQQILTLELDARRLMADETFEQRVIDDLKDRAHEGTPLFEAVERFMSVNSLVDYNVSGALNANFHFMRSFAREGGGPTPEAEILATVWADAEAIEANVSEWLLAYMTTAYAPLDLHELETYIAFSETEAGQALNKALFAGFDTLYQEISQDLGKAAARALQSHDL